MLNNSGFLPIMVQPQARHILYNSDHINGLQFTFAISMTSSLGPCQIWIFSFDAWKRVTQKSSPKWWWKNGDLPWYHPFLKSPNKTNPSFRTKFLRIQGEFTIPNTPSKSCIYQSMNGWFFEVYAGKYTMDAKFGGFTIYPPGFQHIHGYKENHGPKSAGW